MTLSPWKIFFCHNLLRSFYIWCQFEAVFNFQNFKNVRHIEVPTNFFIGFDTGSWIYQQDRHAYFRYFELLIVAQAEILMEIHKLFYLWPGYVTNDVINTDLNKCSHNTMIHIDTKAPIHMILAKRGLVVRCATNSVIYWLWHHVWIVYSL